MAVIFDISQTTWFQQGWMERDKMAREELRLAQKESQKALRDKMRSEQEKNRAEAEKENTIRMSIEILLIKEVPIEFITNTFSVSADYVLEIQNGMAKKK